MLCAPGEQDIALFTEETGAAHGAIKNQLIRG